MSAPAVENLIACYESIDVLIDGLDDAQWAVQSYCPDWTVRGVVEHLGGVEAMLTGEEPGSFTETVPFEKVGAWTKGVADLDNRAFVEAYRQTVAARRAELHALTDEQLALPSMTPVGPQTYGRFMAIRVFDFWVHEQDIRGPLGLPGHEGGPAAEMAIDEIESSMGYIVGKRIGLPDGKSITFRLSGPVERTMHVVVDGRAASVPEMDAAADVVIDADSTTFALLACGRIDPQIPIDAGRISWSGDLEWGHRAAHSLRFTM